MLAQKEAARGLKPATVNRCLAAHRLRHTFANDLVSADVLVTSIQKLMGHTWLETTQTYVGSTLRYPIATKLKPFSG